MAAPKFDNLDDFTTKFAGTVCYYKGEPVFIKSCHQDIEFDPIKEKHVDKGYKLIFTVASGRADTCNVEDPLFNYRDYNIGYANLNGNAVWWFRKPVKQYRQGLKIEQLGCLGQFDGNGFCFKTPYINMLANKYPSIEDTAKAVREGNVFSSAFHKDFALTWDELHEDFILNYRTSKVGVSLNHKLDEYRLLPEYNYLAESLSEALN